MIAARCRRRAGPGGRDRGARYSWRAGSDWDTGFSRRPGTTRDSRTAGVVRSWRQRLHRRSLSERDSVLFSCRMVGDAG